MNNIIKNIYLKRILFVTALLLCVVAIGACTTFNRACTQEARSCPDGSVVGRTGHNCEFAPCPQTNVSRNIGNPDKFSENSMSKSNFSAQYENLKTNFTLKYESFITAVNAFRQLDADKVIGVDSIAFYVGGKVPREDGYPYFIGHGVINYQQNKCVYGYFNLVSGEGKVWQDVCYITG